MRGRVLAAIGAVLLIALAGGWYVLSPAMAMSGLKDALVEGDRDELSERVDFPAVRESVKAQISAMMMAEMQKEKDNPFAGLGMAFGMSMVGNMVDAMITPDGIKAMVQQGRFQEPGKAKPIASQGDTEWAVERKGLDRFEAKPKNEGRVPTLHFKRDGLGWKLVDIVMPPA